MSTESLKTTVTAEMPNFETERISARSGRPLIDTSMGNVICRSTSSGASAGAVVRT
jgi:hypothetical protein